MDVVERIIDVAFFASMRTEESQILLSCLTFADPRRPDHDRPAHVRLHRFKFFPLKERIPLSVRNVSKLAPIAHTAALSIAVFANPDGSPFIWGLVDQEIHHRRTRVFEDDESFGRPGIFEIEVQGVGHVGAYANEDFIGALRTGGLATRRLDALHGGPVFNQLFDPALDMFFDVAERVGVDPTSETESSGLLVNVVDGWLGCLCRVLHRVQRYNHGGALLVTSGGPVGGLNIKHDLKYDRLTAALRASFIAGERAALSEIGIQSRLDADEPVRGEEYRRLVKQRYRHDDAEYAVDGAVAFIAALTQVDGLVLLGPGLNVRGFGVEIREKKSPRYVYVAKNEKGTQLERLKPDLFGTRHRSMFRYCSTHPEAVGFVVSQDGDIRAITNVDGKTVMWEDLNLYKYEVEAFRSRTRSSARRRSRAPR